MNKFYSIFNLFYTKQLSLKKKYSFGLLCRTLILLLFLSSLNLFSQEIENAGLENIHVSGAATIIEKKDNKITIVTSETIKNFETKKTQKVINKDSEEKRIVSISKKSVKKITNKVINEVKNSSSHIYVYNKNSNSEESFVQSNNFSKQGVNSSNNFNYNCIKSENDFVFIIFIHKEIIKVKYNNYSSKNSEENLFTRPPPLFII